jgi:hypothetical protein
LSQRVRFQDTEDVTLGAILVDATEGRFESADEVVKAVKIAASRAGILVVGGDEVSFNEKWEDAFEARGKELHFRDH